MHSSIIHARYMRVRCLDMARVYRVCGEQRGAGEGSLKMAIVETVEIVEMPG